MKVPNINGIVSIARGQVETRNPQQVGKPDTALQTDKVELSSQGQDVLRLAAQTAEEQPRTDLVASLREAYAAGELQADPQAIAEAMVAEGIFDDIIVGD